MTTAPARISREAASRRPHLLAAAPPSPAASILVILAAVAIFLIAQSIPAFVVDPAEIKGEPDSFWAYVGPLVFGTVWAAALALVIAVPLAIGIALFISHYAPRRLAQGLGYIIDLLAAVPSVVFGLWGGGVLAPAIQPVYAWLAAQRSAGSRCSPRVGRAGRDRDGLGTGRTILTVGIVLAVMILPIITAICREIFLQTPKLHEEAALALGATRWEMIRDGRAAVRPLRHRVGVDARPRPRPRRDDGRRDGALARGDHQLRAHQLAEPVDHRGQHRPQLPRGARRRRQRADRDRAHPVRRSPSS